MMRFEMYPTAITPFCIDGSIDFESLENLVKMFAENGCDGMFAVCQSSEMFFISDEEKLELARQSIALCRRFGMKCVVSGHTQNRFEDQLQYLKALEGLSPDAIILVSNRLAKPDEPVDVAVRNLKRLCAALSPDTRLGIYECPYPYKLPLSSELIQAIIEDGRFDFIKDTCCAIEEIRNRLAQLDGSGVRLYNANAATLLESLDSGAAGYSGVMLNIIPEFFSLMKSAALQDNPARFRLAAEHISGTSFVECQNYPTNAKYILKKRGVIQTTTTRNGKPPLTESQMKEMDAFESLNNARMFQLIPHAPVQILFEYDSAFPECHASTVLPLDDGTVLVTYFAGAHEKADDVGIWLSEYRDDSWLMPRCIAKINNEPHWNPVIYRSGDDISILFKVGKEIPQWRSFVTVSKDNGCTWSKPTALSDDNPAGGPVRNKPLLLSDGRLLAPNSDEWADPVVWLPRIDVSTDGGNTFRRFSRIPVNLDAPDRPNHISGGGAIQPTLWESAPGSVHALLRTTAGWIYRSDSADGGRTWCEAYPTDLPNNNSGIDLVKSGNALYLVMNPVTGNWAARTPIIIMRSEDNGRHFEYFRVLEDMQIDESHGHMAEFSYPAIVEQDGMLYITFTHNRKSIAFCRVKTTG